MVTSIDTTKNKIGAEFKLTVKTSVDTLSKVDFPKLKNIGALEVIRSYPIDTIKNNDRYELIKKYGLTQFDSGKYTIPSIKILINSKPYRTDSISVEVANVQVDTLKQKMYDIKDIVPVKSSIGDWWKYLLILALILGIGVLVYWFVKKQQKKKIEEEVYKTPIEKATSLLNTLEQKELWQKGEVKAYYSELTDIARNYIEEAIDIPAMESTTSELILGLRAASVRKKMTVSPETIENLERVLKQADLVNTKTIQLSEFPIDMSTLKKQLQEQFKALYGITKLTDKSFVGAIKAQEVKQTKGLDNLEKRLLKAQKRKLSSILERITDLQNELFPNKSLQERQANFSEFYLESGANLIPRVIDTLKPLEQDFNIITLS